MSITPQKALANLLNGRQMGWEITDAEAKMACEQGLVVVFGYSDDNMEFRGAIYDEAGCFNGGSIFVTRSVVYGDEYHSCNCCFCGYGTIKKTAARITAVWGEEGFSWTYKTDLPHETFVIKEGEENFCRGIVFALKDLPQ